MSRNKSVFIYFRATSAMAGGAKFHDSCYNHGSGGNMVSLCAFLRAPFIAGQMWLNKSVAYGC